VPSTVDSKKQGSHNPQNTAQQTLIFSVCEVVLHGR